MAPSGPAGGWGILSIRISALQWKLQIAHGRSLRPDRFALVQDSKEITGLAEEKLYKAEYLGSGTFVISKPKRARRKIRQSKLKNPQRGSRK
jgi:hypothetical protein